MPCITLITNDIAKKKLGLKGKLTTKPVAHEVDKCVETKRKKLFTCDYSPSLFPCFECSLN